MIMLCEDRLHPSRRRVMGAAGALFAWSFMPGAAAAAGRHPRLVTIVLRGALDGLSALAPVGDPNYLALREMIALSTGGSTPAIPLDGFFALHPAMPNFARLYRAKQALAVHAVATGYRERSHFDGQDILESGINRPGNTDSGWLNRAVALLPKGERVKPAGALGVGTIAPLVMRGPTPILGWAPPMLREANADTARRVLDLYRHTDPVLASALEGGLASESIAGASKAGTAKGGRNTLADPEGMILAAQGAARIMAAEEGPRIAALAFEGWDTHANEGGATGILAQRLGGLDGAIAAFEQGLGAAWAETVILIITEFGRTAHENGTGGSDHGTATLAFLAGGAVKGGRIIADWPGLKPAQLHENRDLKPTTDLRALIKGVLGEHLGMRAADLGGEIFPGSGGDVMRGLTG
jgi:uncharacterized protein (DUF1501 family)